MSVHTERVSVRVIARAKRNAAIRLLDGSVKVWVSAPPVDGKANAMVLELLANLFNVSVSRIQIVRGATQRQKVVEIFRA